MFITYEYPHIGEIFTRSGMKTLYATEVDRNEYATFGDWFYNMIHSGVFEYA